MQLRKSENRELFFILNNFFDQCQGFAMVKKLVTLFAIVFPLRKEEEDLNKIIKFCTNSICPEDEILLVLKGLFVY